MKNFPQYIHALFLGVIGGLASCSAPMPVQPVVVLHSAKSGTEVHFEQSNGVWVVDVRCQQGIGWAKFTLSPAANPDNVMFRLHLRGLEWACFDHDGVETQLSVSSHGDLTVREWYEDGRPIAPKDRIPILPVTSSGGQPCIPLDGWFEIRLPATSAGNCFVRLNWVDFYR